MTDKIAPELRSANMRKIRSKHTKPELIVRSLIHRCGYRYALHKRALPGSPDIVLVSRKKIILVHGCFWHQHSAGCSDARLPKSRKDYWIPKLRRNVARDRANRKLLRSQGWSVHVVWDCETRDVEKLRRRLIGFIEAK